MNNFGRQSLTPGIPVNYNTGVGWEYIQVINESPYMLSLNFSGLGSLDFPAWFRDDVSMMGANGPLPYTGSLTITPTNITSQTGAPSTLVTVNGYSVGELTHPQAVALARLLNVGNQVNTVLGTASAVQNDGSASGTSIVESTVLGDSSSAISLTNNAHLSLGTLNNPALVTIVGSLGVTQQIQIDSLSTLIVPQQIHANLIKTITGNDFVIDVETGHKIAFQVNNADVVKVTNLGIVFLSGGVNFTTGSISQINQFGSTGTGATQIINHGLSVTPDAFIFQYAGNFGSPPTHPIFWFNATSTQVSVHADNGFFYNGIAIKF